MATDHFKTKIFGRSDWQKHPDRDLSSTPRGPDSVMKFSSKLESPPSKPPRRRYSDQLSVTSFGTYSACKKHNEENPKADSKLKTYSPKPAYLSLPTNLTSNLLNESKDSSVKLSHSFNHSDPFKHPRENHLNGKNCADSLNFTESGMKHTYSCNRFNSLGKLLNENQVFNDDHVFQSCYDNSVLHSFDKFSKKPQSSGRVFTTDKCKNQNWKSLPKDCHRRHNSDPLISHFNLQNNSSGLKSDQEQCCNNICSTRLNKSYEPMDTCACCKKSYLIMQEIRILKEINEKLWQHLCSLQCYIETMKKKSHEEFAEVSISSLLSSVYYAQKAKDCAMEERLKVVLEERDAALLELEDLIQLLTKSFDLTDKEKEKDIKELLSEMGCTLNPSKLLKHQRMLLAQIHNLKESKQNCLSHELKQAVMERDNALEKVKKLEEEIKDLKLSFDLWHSDNKHWELTIFDILNQLIHQRDSVLSKIDNGLDISNIIYRSPITGKLETIEHQNASLFECCSKTIESIKSHQSIHSSDYKQSHSFGASDEVIKLKEEILLLNKTLDSEIKKREQAEGKCVRLERLIHILRKKLNGQNIGVPV